MTRCHLCAIFVLLLLPAALVCASEKMDVAILNGLVIDGSGAPGFTADVALRDGRIAYVGSGRPLAATTVIDATGLVVAPGFVDAHSHTGEYLVDPAHRLNESSLTQGVTTVVFGADGMFAPGQLRSMLDKFRRQGVGTNVAFYVGHNGIRRAVMGLDQRRAPTTDELQEMATLVEDGMAMGAVGFSTGLMYEPGRYADTSEVVTLTRAVKDFGGVYDSHVRDPAGNLLASDQEVIQIGREAEVAAKIAHVKAVCLHNAGVSAEVIAAVNTARASGQNVVSDQYPYDGAKTVFLRDLFLPRDLPLDLLKQGLRGSTTREQIRAQSEDGIGGGFSWIKATGYGCIRVTVSRDYPAYVGRYLQEIAREQGRSGFAVIADMLLEADHEVRLTLGGVDETDVRAFLTQPWNMIASDGKYINDQSRLDQHPRSTGTFPRVLGPYVREQGLIPLEEAIRKMTSLPATFLGLADRGRIAVDGAADLVLFDPDTIADTSTWEDPRAFSRGVRFVMVNGHIALREGEVHADPAGQILRRSAPTPATLPYEVPK